MKDCEHTKMESTSANFVTAVIIIVSKAPYFSHQNKLLNLAHHSAEIVSPVAQKPINTNPGLTNNLGFNFLLPNQSHSHNLKINEKKSLSYNHKAKIL